MGESGGLKRDMTALPYIPWLRGYPAQMDIAKKVQQKMDWTRPAVALQGTIGLRVHSDCEMDIHFRSLNVVEL